MSNDIRNKMYDYEVNPPAGMWDKVVAELEISEEDSRIAERVGSIGITPPQDAWTRINDALETTAMQNIKRTGRIVYLRRLAAAAVLIGVIAVTVVLIRNSSKPASTAINNPQNEPQQNPSSTDTPVSFSDTSDKLKEVVSNESLQEPVITVKPANRTGARVLSSSTQQIASNRSQPEERMHTTSFISSTEAVTANTVIDETRYYNLLDEDGNIVRVSRKLASMQCVIKNVSDIPFVNTPEEKACLAKIKEWRNIMANAPALTSPFDLIKIISSNQ